MTSSSAVFIARDAVDLIWSDDGFELCPACDARCGCIGMGEIVLYLARMV